MSYLRGLPAEERFEYKYAVEIATRCWVWLGTLDRDGYGIFHVRTGLQDRAHRFAYRLRHGPVPQGMVLDHFACDRRDCCNPDHLRPVTVRENTLRGNTLAAMNAAKTHCKYGHEFTAENTGRDPDGSRRCRRCDVRRSLAGQARKRARERG